MARDYLVFEKSEEWIDLDKYYNSMNVMKIFGLYKYEDANTNFLASLLDENNIYKLKNLPIKLFLDLVTSKDKNITSKDFNVSNAKSETQFFLDTKEIRKKNSRLDLIVKCKINNILYLVVIEAKIFSGEDENQCKDYYDYLNKCEKYKEYKKIYVYLSLNDKDEISSDKFTKITYQELIDNVYEPCIKQIKKDNKVNNVCLSIDEYLKCFVSLYEYDSYHKYIPITTKERKLIIDLWNKYYLQLEQCLEIDTTERNINLFYDENKTLFKIFLYNTIKVLENKENINELKISDIDKLKNKILNFIKKKKYKPYFDGKYYSNYNDFLYDFFKHLINNKDKVITTITDIDDRIKISSLNWKIIIPESEILYEPHKDYYRLNKKNQEPLKIGNEYIYYCYWNREEEIREFIRVVKEVYPKYECLLEEEII